MRSDTPIWVRPRSAWPGSATPGGMGADGLLLYNAINPALVACAAVADLVHHLVESEPLT